MKHTDEFDQMDDDKASGGDLKQFESYQAFNVVDKNIELEKSAKKLILSLCSVYLEKGLVSNEDYVLAVALAEQQNLFVLLKQVKYSEHILDSLMLQLDAGGYIDKDIYSTIREMQKSAIQITLEVSKFTRTLPEYFKYVQNDIDKIKTSTDILLIAAEQKSRSVQSLESGNSEIMSISESSEFTMTGPVRGTRDMMLHISDVRADIAKAIENATTIDATPITVDDDDDDDDDAPYESLEDDI